MKVAQALWKTLINMYPKSISAKEQFIKENVMVRLVVGNTTELLPRKGVNRYQWTFYIKPAKGEKNLSEHIQKV